MLKPFTVALAAALVSAAVVPFARANDSTAELAPAELAPGGLVFVRNEASMLMRSMFDSSCPHLSRASTS
jgi:hypothetical protein